jgi:hypothetical protein
MARKGSSLSLYRKWEVLQAQMCPGLDLPSRGTTELGASGSSL